MSAVIQFPASRVKPQRDAVSAGPAEVVIFPGVRVERLGFDLAERLPASRRKTSGQGRATDLDIH